MKDGQIRATANQFFDWTFAQKVWFELNTWELEEAEWAKYADDFNTWLPLYKQNPRKALNALKSYPKEKRLNIQRGFDIQLAFDHWFDHVYSAWYNRYPYTASRAVLHKTKAPTFDDTLSSYGQRPSCFPEAMLDECGPVPDWRSPKWRAKEQGMMAKANRQAAEAEAKRKERLHKR